MFQAIPYQEALRIRRAVDTRHPFWRDLDIAEAERPGIIVIEYRSAPFVVAAGSMRTLTFKVADLGDMKLWRAEHGEAQVRGSIGELAATGLTEIIGAIHVSRSGLAHFPRPALLSPHHLACNYLDSCLGELSAFIPVTFELREGTRWYAVRRDI